MSPTILFGFLAGVSAIVAEYMYVKWPAGTPWWHGLWIWAPLQLTIGYCVYRLVTIPGTSVLDAFIVFALATATMRVLLATVILHQDVKVGTWVAFGLIVLANLVRSYWKEVSTWLTM